MKKTFGIMGAVAMSLLAITVRAQQTQTWDPKKNPAVSSINAQYSGKYLAPRPELTTADIFPVIGKYESATNADASAVTISLDADNKGLVWVEGLPQGKIKAMLRQSPATYKIPAQKTEDGKDVAEGTLIFDKETGALSICIGKPYNSEDPSTAFLAPEEQPATVSVKTKSKTKKETQPKAWIYTGTKQVTETVSN
ncbi:MAG: hypothetical protein ABI688_00415 [Bacteroidota bacterium]